MTSPLPPVLSIGVVLGDSDPTSLAWKRSMVALAKEVVASRGGVESPLRVNVVFHVDGRLVPNEFEGVRTGRFSRKDNHLMVQVAVSGVPVAESRTLLLNLLEQAVGEAEVFARARGIADELAGLHGIVNGLRG